MSARRKADEAVAESDRFGDTPHPRQTYQLLGHAAAEAELLDAYRSGHMPQSLILGGPEGIGKATLAWRIARFLLANPDPASASVRTAHDLSVGPEHPVSHRVEALSHSDIYLLRREWNANTNRHFTEISVNDIRRMLDRFHQASAAGGWRIAIVDCAEDLNRNSANAMLKLIEEPPPRSLFLFIANRPARVLPTIRSRSRMLHLSALGPDDIVAAVRALGEPWSEFDEAELRAAAQRAHGSVKSALRYLDGAIGALESIESLLGTLPAIDWRAAHTLADSVQSRQKTEDFEAIVTAVFDWIAQRTETLATHNPPDLATLARLAELWEKIAASARRTETYNLDRRPFLLTTLKDLAGAASLAPETN